MYLKYKISFTEKIYTFNFNVNQSISNFTKLGEPWQFTDWGPGKPENDGTALNILWDFYAGCLWKWNDDHTEKSTPFICESKLSTNETFIE